MPNLEEQEDILLAKLAVAYGLLTKQIAADLLQQKKKLSEEQANYISLNNLMIEQQIITPEQSQKIFELRDQVLLQCAQCKSVYRLAKYKLNTSPTCKRCRVLLPVPEKLPELHEDDFSLSFQEYPPQTEGLFTILAGTHVGESFLVNPGDIFTLGRAEGVNLQISDGAISRKQCEITREGNHFFVQDLESRWGTYVNGKKVQKKASLHFGDLIKIGNTVIEFRPQTHPTPLEARIQQAFQGEELQSLTETQKMTKFSPIQNTARTLVPELSDPLEIAPESPQKTPSKIIASVAAEHSAPNPKENSKLIHGYDILEKLGAGKMGVVYRAIQKETGNQVALKIMKPPDKHHKERVKRFIQEARILCEMDHPNIIKGCDVGVSEPYYFIAMEVFEGYPASYLLSHGGKFSERRAALVLLHISRALAYMEKRNLLHRDIKPSNILVNRERTLAKLCDMGLAKMLDHDLSLTKAGCAVGTPFYNSPEVAQGKEIDIRSDIYSLGATLYHLVTGDVPYRGETTVDILIKHVRAPVPEVAKFAPQISPRLAKIITKMLAKRPEDRFASAEELVDVLKPYYRIDSKS